MDITMESVNVLSLFDGMSCGQIALDELGIPVGKYYAAEIDEYAITITKKNYPNTIHLGDVTKVDGTKLDKIDLLIGGSPCQGFSFAGKQLNFNDPRSALFFEYVRLLKECKPKYFMLENVRMKQEFQDIISSYLGVEPVMINSALLSAQNRVRLYWTNIPNVTQPQDMGIVLKDILEDGVVDRDKSHCLDANYFKGGNLKSYFEKHRRQLVFSKDGLCHVGDADIKGNDSIKRVYHPDGKAPTLTTMQGGHREPKILCGAFRGRYYNDEGKRVDHKQKVAGLTKQTLEIREDGKTNTLTTVQKDNVVTVNDAYYRKLTPLECERLQTVPDGYTEISEAKEYLVYNNLETNKKELLCDVNITDVKTKQQHINTGTYVLNITKDLLDMEQQNSLKNKATETKNVNIAIELLGKKEAEQEGCVIDTTKIGSDIKTHYTQIKLELLRELGGIKNELVVKTFTGKYMKILLGENSAEMKLFIMSILLKLITELKIFTYVMDRANIRFSIGNLNQLPDNSLSLELLNLNMASISLMSNTQRYKMLGNGWTVAVIKHIFKGIQWKPSSSVSQAVELQHI